MQVQKYRMSRSTIALVWQEDRQVACTVPLGEIISVESISVDGLVEVRWNETTVMMFAQDIRARGEKV